MKPWLVKSVKESDCKVTDNGSHMKHVSTKIDGEVEKDTVTPDEEMGKIMYMTSKTLPRVRRTFNHHKIYRRNVRDKLRVETGVQMIVAKNTLSMMKLAGR